ncbi:MAG: serine/threonine protein kinase [Azoarcus sp.]|nr:serine/threonine protein kinase [Azoarcus sp.]
MMPADANRRDMSVPAASLPVGSRLGEFEIRAVLGVGKFSMVYKAYDRHLDRYVALKEYFPANIAQRAGRLRLEVSSANSERFADGLKRFFAEAHVMSRFQHPVLRSALRLLECNGTAYIAMPYYPGQTLREMVSAGYRAQTWEDLFSTLLPILSGLSQIHREHLCHMNVSPDNILIQSNSTPLLLDFGDVRRFGENVEEALPTDSFTPGFAAKEQYEDNKRTGPWTDIYGISAVAYYMVTGIVPIISISRGTGDALTPLTVFATPNLPADVLGVIDEGLAVHPQNRIGSIEIFAKLLEEATHMATLNSGVNDDSKAVAINSALTDLPPEQRKVIRYASWLRDQFRGFL